MGIAPPKSFAPDVMKVAETVLPPKPASSNGAANSGAKIKQAKMQESASKKKTPTVMSEGQYKCHHYRPQTKFAKVMFLQVSVCPQGWCAWKGGVRGCGGVCMVAGVGACMVAGGMHSCGGVCVVAGGCTWLWGAYVFVGGMHGGRGHAWWQGGMRGIR